MNILCEEKMRRAHFTSHQDRTEQSDTATGRAVGYENARDVTCAVIPRRPDEVQSASVMAHPDDLQWTWKFLIKLYSASTTFKKALLHSTLMRTQNREQAKKNYVARLEQMSAQLPWMDATIYEGLLVTMLLGTFADRLRSTSGTALSLSLSLRWWRGTISNGSWLLCVFCKSSSCSMTQGWWRAEPG